MMEGDWQGPMAGAPVSMLTQWLILISVVALTALGVVLTAVILRKAGRHWLWSVLFLFPLAYLIGLWVFAFTRWPNTDAVAAGNGLGGRRDDEPPFIGPAPTSRRSFSDRRRW